MCGHYRVQTYTWERDNLCVSAVVVCWVEVRGERASASIV
jgi:hypothetical protein